LTEEVVFLLQQRKASAINDFVFPSIGKTGHLTEPKKVGRESLKVQISAICASMIYAEHWVAGRLVQALH
jgi:hypothetical protein